MVLKMFVSTQETILYKKRDKSPEGMGGGTVDNELLAKRGYYRTSKHY